MTTTTDRPVTGAEASLYQQLRGHLANLRLTAAAEALPTVLDTANTEGLSLTAALERLLRIEVDATDARRLAGRLRFASLPTPASLDDFDYDAQPAVDRSLIAELGTCRYIETATNVLLIGPPGVGKTHCETGSTGSARTGARLAPAAGRDPKTHWPCPRAGVLALDMSVASPVPARIPRSLA